MRHRVEVGQTFADMDPRDIGRYLVVQSIDGEHAEVGSWWSHDQRDHHGRRIPLDAQRAVGEMRTTRIHVERLRPPHYQLVCVRVMGIDAAGGHEVRCGLPEFADVHDPLGHRYGDVPEPLFVHPFDTVPALDEDQPVRFVELPEGYQPVTLAARSIEQEAR